MAALDLVEWSCAPKGAGQFRIWLLICSSGGSFTEILLDIIPMLYTGNES